MAPIETAINFDNNRNAVIITFSGQLESVGQLETILENISEAIVSVSQNGKVWCIADYTSVVPGGYSVTHFIRMTRKRLVSVFKNHTLGRIAIIRNNPNARLFVNLFGTLIGSKAHICISIDDAITLLDKLSNNMKKHHSANLP
jgi:hypothetical protein